MMGASSANACAVRRSAHAARPSGADVARQHFLHLCPLLGRLEIGGRGARAARLCDALGSFIPGGARHGVGRTGEGRTGSGHRPRRARRGRGSPCSLPIASCVPAAAVSGPAVTIAVAETPAPAVPAPAAGRRRVAPDLAAPGGGLAGSSAPAPPMRPCRSPAASTRPLPPTSSAPPRRSTSCARSIASPRRSITRRRSESEDGQRAVAQVVLNRVRHPAWPNSVCGVVYQGADARRRRLPVHLHLRRLARPRAGGRRLGPRPPIAAEALAGRTFARRRPVDLYQPIRLPGLGAAPGQDRGDRRAQFLPPARPRRRARRVQRRLCRQRAAAAPGPILHARAPRAARFRRAGRQPPRPRSGAAAGRALRHPAGRALGRRATCPNPTIREEYRQSGQWRDDAPAALTGR